MEIESTYASPVGVKLTFGNEMRRFQFVGGSYSAFYAQVVAILGLEPSTEVLLKYTDEENDLITLSSDLELRSAIAPNQLLRVVVVHRNQPSVPQHNQAPHTPINPRPNSQDDDHVEFFQHAPSGHRHEAQFYQPYHQQPAGEKWDKKGDDKVEKDAKKLRKEAEKKEKKERKEVEKQEKKERKMLKKGLDHSPHHHPYQHPHARHHDHKHKHAGSGHGPHGHGPHGHGPHAHGPYGHHAHEGGHGPHGHGPHGYAPQHEEKHGKFVARFVADVATFDGTVIPPNTGFIKTWRMRNEGAAWPADCGLFFIGRLSDKLEAPTFLPIGEIVAPHQEINISVPLVAPAKPGRYTAYFRMCTADGVKFGQRVWVSIVVPAGDSSSSPSSSEGEKEADKYEELVDVVMRNDLFRSVGMKRHWVFRQLQKHNGDVGKVVEIMTKKVEKKMKKIQKKN